MAAMSNYLESQVITHIFRTGTFVKPTSLALALCTAAVTDTHTGANIPELANAGSYARQAVNPNDTMWTGPTSGNGTTTNTPAITFPTASADWGTISYVAIVDNASYGAGNLIFYGALATTKIVSNGDTFQFASTNLQVQVDN